MPEQLRMARIHPPWCVAQPVREPRPLSQKTAALELWPPAHSQLALVQVLALVLRLPAAAALPAATACQGTFQREDCLPERQLRECAEPQAQAAVRAGGHAVMERRADRPAAPVPNFRAPPEIEEPRVPAAGRHWSPATCRRPGLQPMALCPRRPAEQCARHPTHQRLRAAAQLPTATARPAVRIPAVRRTCQPGTRPMPLVLRSV